MPPSTAGSNRLLGVPAVPWASASAHACVSWWRSGDYAGDLGTLFGWPGCPLPDGLCCPGFGWVCDALREKEKRSGLESTRGIRAPYEAPAQVWGQAYAASPWLYGSNILKFFKTSMLFAQMWTPRS